MGNANFMKKAVKLTIEDAILLETELTEKYDRAVKEYETINKIYKTMKNIYYPSEENHRARGDPDRVKDIKNFIIKNAEIDKENAEIDKENAEIDKRNKNNKVEEYGKALVPKYITNLHYYDDEYPSELTSIGIQTTTDEKYLEAWSKIESEFKKVEKEYRIAFDQLQGLVIERKQLEKAIDTMEHNDENTKYKEERRKTMLDISLIEYEKTAGIYATRFPMLVKTIQPYNNGSFYKSRYPELFDEFVYINKNEQKNINRINVTRYNIRQYEKEEKEKKEKEEKEKKENMVGGTDTEIDVMIEDMVGGTDSEIDVKIEDMVGDTCGDEESSIKINTMAFENIEGQSGGTDSEFPVTPEAPIQNGGNADPSFDSNKLLDIIMQLGGNVNTSSDNNSTSYAFSDDTNSNNSYSSDSSKPKERTGKFSKLTNSDVYIMSESNSVGRGDIRMINFDKIKINKNTKYH